MSRHSETNYDYLIPSTNSDSSADKDSINCDKVGFYMNGIKYGG